MSDETSGKSEIEILACPKCSRPVFEYSSSAKFCPTCNYHFEHSSVNKEKERRKKIKKEGMKRRNRLYVYALLISLLVVSVSLYYLWLHKTETNLITIYDVGDIRELEPKKDVPPDTMSKNELKKYLEDLMTDEEKARIEKEETIYRCLFIIDEDFDILNISLESSIDQIAGFYDPETKKMYVIGDHISSYINYILSHEYTHALQDQYFDLNTYLENVSYDQHLARLSVAEGDATLVMNKYASTMSWEEMLLMTLDMMYTLGTSIIDLANIEGNKALSSLTMFPYLNGLSFVQKVYDESGWDGVNALYENPPASSEQIIHYEKYSVGEPPVEINFELPVDGFELEFSETLGEYFIAQMLDIHIAPVGDMSLPSMMGVGITSGKAMEAAAGWGGDQFYYYTKGDEFLSVLDTTWDTVKENNEFNTTYDEMLQILAYPEEGGISSVRGGYLYKTSSDLNTTIYYSSNRDVVENVIEYHKEYI